MMKKSTPPDGFTYWAFISYSHRDEAFCSWLHKELEGYKTPPTLVDQTSRDGSYAIPKKLYPIFRDRDELAAGASLNDALTTALSHARYLIVICSPNSAQSYWVNEEVRHFESLGREKYILPIILDGEPNDPEGKRECFPPALRAPKEPVAADAREGKDGKEAALMKLRAGLLGVRLEDLVNRELQRRQKEAWRNQLIAVFMLLLAILAVVGGWLAWEGKQEADIQKKESQHHYGLALAEKADRAFAELNTNEGQIYAAHALARIDWERGGDTEITRLSTLGIRLGQPGIPVFTQPAGKYNYIKNEILSPDQKIRASVDGKTIRLWEVATGKLLALLVGHEGAVVDVSFSVDGKILASGSSDKTIRLWDIANGKQLSRLTGHQSAILGVSFSADGKKLISGGEDGVIRLWDVAATKRALSLREGYNDKDKSARDEALSPDGKTYASLGKDGKTISLFDAATGKPLAQFKGQVNSVTSISFSPDGKIFASGCGDKTVRLWDVVSGKPLAQLNGHEEWVNAVSFSPDGKILASWSEDKTVRLWDVASGKPLALLEGHEDWVMSTAFSPDGKTLVSKDWRNNVKQWSLEDIYIRDWAAQAARDEKQYGFKLRNFKLVPLDPVDIQETSK